MTTIELGLGGMAVVLVLLIAALVRSGQLARMERGAATRRDTAPRRTGPEADATGDAVAGAPTLQARLDELDYRFAALKVAHETLAESIGTRFLTMGKRITRAGAPAQPSEIEDDPSQSDFLTALGGGPSRSSSSAPHNGARRLISRSAPRR